MYKKRLRIFAAILSLLVVFDAFKFFAIGGATIINWHSFVHPFWAILAAVLYFAGAMLNRRWFWNTLLALYSIVFVTAVINQYVPFTTVITANCALFNLVFIPLYLFLGSNDIG